MGVVGFALAFAFGNWGLAHSTASNAALLITVEPTTLLVLAPLLLGERLSRRETVGAALTLLGAVVVVVNGVPGLTQSLMPHWRGDLVLILSGVAYAAYSLLGRGVLTRHPVSRVTAHSVVWGAASIAPLALYEWHVGPPPAWTAGAIAGTVYLGVVITALGYGVWNWCLERVGAARVAAFVNVQPLAGALLGVWWLQEPLTPFLVAGGVLIVAGLHLTVNGARRG
jgi:drug/metabolite transporter (DMT)-like permease